MEKILTIQKAVVFDESIANWEIHAHKPHASATFNNNDEIRIAVQHQDLCILPSKSSLHICGRLTKADGRTPAAATKFVNMAICHLFEEIRYEINAVEIDRNKNCGLTSVMKGLVSLHAGQTHLMENAGWLQKDDDKITNDEGYFDIDIPLSLLLGFAEDYHRIIVNAKHELILVRANTDTNAIVQTEVEQFKISIEKIDWLIPYIQLSDVQKIHLLNYIAKDPAIRIPFRSWGLNVYPLLHATTTHDWLMQTTTQLEKARYIIVGFQTKRKNSTTKNASHFDHCNLRNFKLHLNSQSYPYGNVNLDFTTNQFALLYTMYANFQSSYYNKTAEPLLSKAEFADYAPLIVIDCSKQNENLKSGPIDIRLEFESSAPFPPETSAYCLVIHDRIVEYNPISGTVRKIT